MPQVSPPVWTDHQLESERQQAREVFIQERVGEPLEQYLEAFQNARASLETIIELTVDLTEIREHAVEILSDPELAGCCRYLASPPISADDLETVAGVTMAPTLIARDPERAQALMEAILLGLDRERFPWVSEDREPTEAEIETAIVSTAAMAAMRKVETLRRNAGKNQQEQAVKDYLSGECDYTEVAARDVPNLSKAPGPGEFCKESKFGSRKADIIVGLWDGRVMPIECKVSNSATNSYKRLNNDAAVKAVAWRKEFGDANVVPVAVLSGVFTLGNLNYAQERKLTLFWAYDLNSLGSFISATKN